ncbi:ROK family protein [Flavihumibacter sp. ZG627]|uniref:ROK family protein n=1 Tax=Flavihumibacter sp. ZG627 TaxID=1463156 RepID=UPI00057F4CC4|nr:ROK family protein [Flavihumibacter sp. ZG627]KIC91080.1 ROK family transcriptional regulator [Flavihumibacter sp. ZG627]
MASKTDYYKKKILKELCFGSVLSGTEISTRIERSLPLTLRILTELVEEGIVEEKGYAPSTGGRRPLMYSLVAGKMYVVSVAMDQLITKIGLVDLQNAQIVKADKFPIDLKQHADSLAELTRYIKSYCDASGISYNKIIGVGIGMPGFVDVRKGINYSYLDNKGKSIVKHLEEELGLPVFIDNDSSLIALAEFKLGAARGKNNAMVINTNWGVGLGMIINGELFRGYNGFAGEFSHMPLFNNNKLCSCGKSGCLETEASLLEVIEKMKQGLKNGRVSILKKIPDDYEEACSVIIGAAVKGDQFAVELLSEIAYNIGRGIAILIHILNPELIVLSGRGASAGHLWLAPVQQAVNRYCIPRLAAYTTITVSNFNTEAELIGAAALVVENFEKDPTENILADHVINQ